MSRHLPDYGTVAYWFREFTEHGGLSPATVKVYKARFRKYIEIYYGESLWNELKRKDLHSYWKDLYDLGYSDSMINDVLGLWQGMAGYVEKETGTECPFLDRSAVRKARHQISSPVSVNIINHIRQCNQAPSTILLLCLGYYIGMKLQMALQIRVTEWDLIHCTFETPSHTAGFEVDIMPFPSFMNEYYEKIMREPDRLIHPTEWLFADAQGKPWTTGKAAKMIAKLLKREELPQSLTYESFRSAFGAKAEEAGLNRNTTEKMMGNGSARTRRWSTACSYELQNEIAQVPWKRYCRVMGLKDR